MDVMTLWQSKVLTALSQRTETNEIDFKESLSEDNERLREHINAFGNSRAGGLFVFGISPDFTLKPDAMDQEAVIRRVTDLARDTQEPSLNVDVLHLEIQGRVLLGMLIHPGRQQPVFIRDRSPMGGRGCYRRSGSSTIPMSTHEIREFLMRSSEFSLDEEPLEGATLEGLNFSELKSVIPAFSETDGLSNANLQVLLDNKIISANGRSGPIPTLAGWLLFANNVQSLRAVKNCSIEFQQFRGTTRDEPLKKFEIVGTLPRQVELAIETIQQNIWTVPKMQGIKREDVPAYDLVSLREAVTNSVVHRDYSQLHQPVKIALFSDRLEIENPGSLMPGLTPLNLIHKREWRNPTIASMMGKFGLGEMDGQGIDRIYSGTKRIKVPAPKITDEQRSFKMTLSAPKAFEDYTPEEKRFTVMVLLILEREIDNESLRNAFGIDNMKASTLLKSLVADRLITRVNTSRKNARYRFTEDWEQRIFG